MLLSDGSDAPGAVNCQYRVAHLESRLATILSTTTRLSDVILALGRPLPAAVDLRAPGCWMDACAAALDSGGQADQTLVRGEEGGDDDADEAQEEKDQVSPGQAAADETNHTVNRNELVELATRTAGDTHLPMPYLRSFDGPAVNVADVGNLFDRHMIDGGRVLGTIIKPAELSINSVVAAVAASTTNGDRVIGTIIKPKQRRQETEYKSPAEVQQDDVDSIRSRVRLLERLAYLNFGATGWEQADSDLAEDERIEEEGEGHSMKRRNWMRRRSGWNEHDVALQR